MFHENTVSHEISNCSSCQEEPGTIPTCHIFNTNLGAVDISSFSHLTLPVSFGREIASHCYAKVIQYLVHEVNE